MNRTEKLIDAMRVPSAAEIGPDAFGIAIDSREQNPFRFADEIPVLVRALTAGDYAPVGYETRAAVERKSLDDLIGSITAGHDRFRRELQRLAEFDFAAVVIEADLYDLHAHRYRSRLEPAQAASIVSTLHIKYGVPFLWCGSKAADWTVRLLRSWWTHRREVQSCAPRRSIWTSSRSPLRRSSAWPNASARVSQPRCLARLHLPRWTRRATRARWPTPRAR